MKISPIDGFVNLCVGLIIIVLDFIDFTGVKMCLEVDLLWFSLFFAEFLLLDYFFDFFKSFVFGLFFQVIIEPLLVMLYLGLFPGGLDRL